MKKQVYFIFLFLVFGLTTNAQTIDFIKFKANDSEKWFTIFIGREYRVKLNPLLITNLINKLDSNYNPNTGIELKLVGCTKDSLFFEKGISIPLMLIQSIDNIKERTIWYSIAIATNFAIIGAINYGMWLKFNDTQFIFTASSPFALTAFILGTRMPNQDSKFYLNVYHIKEYRYKNKVTNKIHYYNIGKQKNIFEEY